MSEHKPLNRRSFLSTVAGATVAGGAMAAVGGAAQAQQRPTGRSDSDSGDRGGYGRTGVTDRDPSDSPGRGVGGGSRPQASVTDSDRGNVTGDRPGRGRGPRRQTGRSDSDTGAGADRPGYGR